MLKEGQASRRGWLLSVGATTLLAACGGGSGGGGSSGGGSSSSSSSSSTSSASSSASSSSAYLPDPATAPALKTHFAANFKVGMVADPDNEGNAIIDGVMTKHASSTTAENAMKPHVIGVSAGTYNFGPGDAVVAYAQARGISVRGHTLLWHSSAPDWFFDGDATAATYAATVQARLETYIRDVVTHFKGKVYAWDVVNEVASDDGAVTYRDSKWFQILGEGFVEIAFRAARAADGDVKLFINDYGTEDPGKLSRLMTIVDRLRTRGAPIDGIGHQFHINTAFPTVDNAKAALVAGETRNLINHVTELDVSLYTSDGGGCYGATPTGCQAEFVVGTPEYDAALKAQAQQYRAMYNLFVQHPSVASVTTWGACDLSTWLAFFPVTRLNHPLLFDTAGNPKSAFWAIVDAGFVI